MFSMLNSLFGYWEAFGLNFTAEKKCLCLKCIDSFHVFLSRCSFLNPLFLSLTQTTDGEETETNLSTYGKTRSQRPNKYQYTKVRSLHLNSKNIR